MVRSETVYTQIPNADLVGYINMPPPKHTLPTLGDARLLGRGVYVVEVCGKGSPLSSKRVHGNS